MICVLRQRPDFAAVEKTGQTTKDTKLLARYGVQETNAKLTAVFRCTKLHDIASDNQRLRMQADSDCKITSPALRNCNKLHKQLKKLHDVVRTVLERGAQDDDAEASKKRTRRIYISRTTNDGVNIGAEKVFAAITNRRPRRVLSTLMSLLLENPVRKI